MGNKQMYCTQCGFRGKPRKKIKGNCYIEIFLILFAFAAPLYFYLTNLRQNYSQAFLYLWGLIVLCFIPEIIYRIWRYSSRVNICPMCKIENSMIAAELKSGKKPEKHSEIEELDQLICPNCLNKNDKVYKFCLSCGSKLIDDDEEKESEEDVLILEEIPDLDVLDVNEIEDEEK